MLHLPARGQWRLSGKGSALGITHAPDGGVQDRRNGRRRIACQVADRNIRREMARLQRVAAALSQEGGDSLFPAGLVFDGGDNLLAMDRHPRETERHTRCRESEAAGKERIGEKIPQGIILFIVCREDKARIVCGHAVTDIDILCAGRDLPVNEAGIIPRLVGRRAEVFHLFTAGEAKETLQRMCVVAHRTGQDEECGGFRVFLEMEKSERVFPGKAGSGERDASRMRGVYPEIEACLILLCFIAVVFLPCHRCRERRDKGEETAFGGEADFGGRSSMCAVRGRKRHRYRSARRVSQRKCKERHQKERGGEQEGCI